MRRLIWLIVVVSVLWSSWWFVAAQGVLNGIDAWVVDRRAAGWQADIRKSKMSGYPLELVSTLQDPAFADPQTGVAVTLSALEVSAPAWWPGYVTLRLPEDTMRIANPSGSVEVEAKDLFAALRLKPGTNLTLEELSLTSNAWNLRDQRGDLASAQSLTLRMKQDAQNAQRYDVTVDVTALEPGAAMRAEFFIPQDWPVSFDSFELDTSVVFDRPWDRASIENARPQPRQISIALAQASWGELRLRAAAELDVDADGLPTGTLSLQVRNWRDMVNLAETTGVLPSQLKPQLENILSALANSSGNPNAFDITLTFTKGLVSVGFIPLGRAPPLILR